MYINLYRTNFFLFSELSFSERGIPYNVKHSDVSCASNVRSADRCYELTILRERGSLLWA